MTILKNKNLVDITHLVPRLRHLRCPGTNLITGCSLKQALAGDRFRDATVARSLTDSRELDELGTGDGGSSFKDSLKTPLRFQSY